MKERLTAPTGEPYYFPSTSAYECVWYAYYRFFELFNCYPCYRNAQKGQGFNDAKMWDKFKREYMEITEHCVAGDIVEWDGNKGHVAIVERVNGDGTCLLSQYNLDAKKGFSVANWKIGTRLVGKVASTGNFKCFLHYKFNKDDKDYETLYREAQSKLDKIKEIING